MAVASSRAGLCSVTDTSALEAITGRSHADVACALEVSAALFGVGRNAVAFLQHHAKIGTRLRRFQVTGAFERGDSAKDISRNAGTLQIDARKAVAPVGPPLPARLFIELRGRKRIERALTFLKEQRVVGRLRLRALIRLGADGTSAGLRDPTVCASGRCAL